MMQELCLLGDSRTTPYHPASDGLVERFNGTAYDVGNVCRGTL